jgi:uncharacterized membrane protein YoaK (UPF0700 family)
MLRTLLQSAAARERSKHADMQLGVILAFVGGAINAGGFLAVGQYTSHMTGIVSSIGDALALHAYDAALSAVLFLTCFISGATLSSFLVNAARLRHYHSVYAAPLMLEAVLLLVFGFSATGLFPSVAFSLHATIGLLCFLMGLQNALISKISHSVIRTTHVTGISTDIGIELGRRLFRALGHPDLRVNRERLSIPARQLTAFLSGSIAGAFAFSSLGFMAVIPLALVLLSITPILQDLRGLPQE